MNIIKITLTHRITNRVEVTITINGQNPFKQVKQFQESFSKDIPSFFDFIKEEVLKHLKLDASEQIRMNDMLDSLQRRYKEKLDPNPTIRETIYLVESE